MSPEYKLLKTLCNDCAFFIDHKTGCFLGKETYPEGNCQFVNGFCRHKRKNEWMQHFSGDIYKASDACIHNGNNYNTTLIIKHFNKDIQSLIKTIESIEQIKSLIIKIIIVTDDTSFLKDERWPKQILAPWYVEHILNNETLEVVQYKSNVLHWCMNMVSTQWMMGVESGDKFWSQELVSDVVFPLYNINNNPICFYYDIEDSLRCVVNVQAFKEIRGNEEENWFDKIKTFKNWESLCIRMTSKSLQSCPTTTTENTLNDALMVS